MAKHALARVSLVNNEIVCQSVEVDPGDTVQWHSSDGHIALEFAPNQQESPFENNNHKFEAEKDFVTEMGMVRTNATRGKRYSPRIIMLGPVTATGVGDVRIKEAP